MVAAYPGNPSHPGALTRCKPSCTDQQCGPAKHSRTMTNDCDRSHSAMSRHNYMRKRNRQLYCSSMESQTVLLDSRRCTMVRQDALWWNWMSQAKMRASTSLRQFWLTHADALHFQIQLTSVATAVDLYLGTSTDTTLVPASLWTQQDLPHCITSGVEDIPTIAGWDPSLDERKTMPFIKRVNDLSSPLLHSSARL